MRSHLFFGAALVLALTGCSTLNPWNGEYACKGYPEGVNCKSAREVYELTNYRDSLEKPHDSKKADCPECGEPSSPANPGSPGGAVAATVPASTQAVQGLGYAGPMPLRSAAEIMRVWIAPWESMDGALHLPAYLYAEVEGRRWSIGGRRMEVAPRITLLDSRATPKPPVKTIQPNQPKESKKPLGREIAPPSLENLKHAPKNSYFDRKTGQSRLQNLNNLN
jgi:conjugal transfer pilus assembly protein TraV